jgi:hypothetical protein
MRINATFIGRTSLGFETGNTYEIKVRQTWRELQTGALSRSKMVKQEELGEYLIQVETVETRSHKHSTVTSRCLYSTSKKFLENWKLNTFRDCTVGWNLDDYEFEKHTILSQMRDSKLKILI